MSFERNGEEPVAHPFRLGRFQAAVVNDGNTSYATAGYLFASAPEDALLETLAARRLDPGAIVCANNCLVVDTDGQRVLIDAGLGGFRGSCAGMENAGRLLDNLAFIGIGRETVDIVLLSHFHGDHVGGLIDDGGAPSFPNARIFISEPDWEAGWSAHPSIRRIWTVVRDRVSMLRDGQDVVPGIRAILAPGHTRGHAVYIVESEGLRLFVLGDLVAHPLHIERPEWTMSSEPDWAQSAASRLRILRMIKEEGLWAHSYHIAFPGLGRVVSEWRTG
jgi:glyoxylase-like metal-dependent hydrolase (beta-lactamase superfamily II)